MKQKTFCLIGGTIFGAVALVHVLRAMLQIPVYIGAVEIAPWLSYCAAAVTGALCVLGLTAAKQ